MKNIDFKRVIIISLFCSALIIGVFCYNYFSDDKKTINSIDNRNMFAVLVQGDDGSYKEYYSNRWPSSSTYIYDSVKSGCLDGNGNKLNGVLSYNTSTKVATVNTDQTTYCYLYFNLAANDLYNLCSTYSNLNTCMLTEYNTGLKNINNITNYEQGGMRRYQGSAIDVTNNYICFGTNDTSECTSNKEKYLYRIIGITPDGKMKLLKRNSLNDGTKWHIDSETSVSWPTSDLFNNLNTTLFLENINYVPAGWQEKISLENWKYRSGTFETDNVALWVYNQEINNTIDSVAAKIGLLYIHDYYFQSKENLCTYNGDIDTCINGWLPIKNNDNNTSLLDEWTMVEYDCTSPNNLCMSYMINSSGIVIPSGNGAKKAVRPVFYLNSAEALLGGDGTLQNPYLIKN